MKIENPSLSAKATYSSSFNNELFQVPMQFIGQRIHVRYDSTDLSKAYIFSSEGKCLEVIAPVNNVDSIANALAVLRDELKDLEF